jgi:hypothetical protein
MEMLRRFLPRLSDARPGASDSVVAIYQARKATVLLWSSRRLRAADYQQVLRLAFYHLDCERQL